MIHFDETERSPLIDIPEDNSALIQLPKKKSIFQPPPIDPALQMKWGLALLGEEKAKEYLRWLQLKRSPDSQ